ncbi:HAD-like protein [Dichomitus squalens]|uniref:HAD-like protein n=1 Tax=Dichomitus squalens TaxID=114155 RepID=A0A4Q9M6F2_9APHY|nr:HAD-like protein [Dichomitus squalens]TBU48024.1 HAD-like protein [Dichomitus squalens]TBU59422.1 HAD-like protein [Dichomitus squalens]
MSAPFARPFDTIVFDIRSALFMRGTQVRTPIPTDTLRRILRSATWFEYEKGTLSETECHALIAAEFSLSLADVADTFRAARASTRADSYAIHTCRNIKERMGIRLIAMSNIPELDWTAFECAEPELCQLFDHIFTSAAAGERKPNLGFYHYVLHESNISPSLILYIDDKVENVVSAKSVGMKGLVCTTAKELSSSLTALVRNPITDGQHWLQGHAKRMWSVTDTGAVIRENFSQLLLIEVTGDPRLADVLKPQRLSNFFIGEGVLTTAMFPNDMDTTSIACTVLDHFTTEVKNDIMDEILSFRNRDGIVQTYFDRARPRIDPVVCVNVLAFFHINGRGHDLAEVLEWVYDVLSHRAYESGTLYYHSGDAFLYFLSRMIQMCPSLRERFGGLLAARVLERYGIEGDSLALAMRIYSAASIGLHDIADYRKLLAMQQEDGSWPTGWFYRNGSSGILTGNQGLTTAIAVSAIHAYQAL